MELFILATGRKALANSPAMLAFFRHKKGADHRLLETLTNQENI
jgi:hypothetical protein